MKFCIVGFFIGFLVFDHSHGKIFSTEFQEAQKLSKPTLVSLNSVADEFGNQPLQKFKKFLTRQRRSPPSVKAPTKQLKVDKFDLGNDTSHNQALIHWSGNYSHVIFILTRRKDHSPGGKITQSTLWRSDDYGVIYENQQNLFDGNTILQSYFVCPTNKSKVVFIDTYNHSGRVWVSTDEGASYLHHDIQFTINKIEFHPDQQDWLLGYDKNAQTLYASQNLARTWTRLQTGVTKDRYFWYIKGVDEQNTAVHMEYRDFNVFPQTRYAIKSCLVPNCIPTAFQAKCDKLENIDMDSLVVQNNFTFVQQAGAREKLYVSYRRGDFFRARFDKTNEQTDFHIVSSNSGTVVTGVKHSILGPQTDLYFSDSNGKYFTIGISNVRYFARKSGDDEVFTVDIHGVKAVTGTFIANVRTQTGQNQTRITSDHGRTWQYLKPPKLDYNGNLQQSCTKCSLNLHVAMSQTKSGYYMPGMLSKATIPGLIISHGSIGRTLIDAPSLVSLFISNDAGQTWREVRDKRHLFVAADHGAMLVAVKMIFLKPITSLFFSNDVGHTWTEHQFSKEAINVDGLLTEPGEYTHKFTLFGHRNYRDHWKLFALDLSPLVPRNCSFPEDFETWTFTTQRDQVSQNPSPVSCNLGMVQKFERVRATHCLIGLEYKRSTSKVACNCSHQDYECAFGYFMLPTGQCSINHPKIDNIGDVIDDGDGDEDYDTWEYPYPESSDCVNGKQQVFSGFRKIPGDICVNELAGMQFKNVNCSPTTPLQRTTSTTPPSTVKLTLLNKTSEAQIGQELHFSVLGSEFDLTVRRTVEPGEKVESKLNKSVGALAPKKPGDYEIRAVNKRDHSISDTLIVSFWYAIEEVHIYHPPVVEVNIYYNVTAAVTTKFGLVGTESLLGPVDYYWIKDDQFQITPHSSSQNSARFRHDDVKDHSLVIIAKNKVSKSSSHSRVSVKEYLETLILPFQCSPPINSTMLTHAWLQELSQIVTTKISKLPQLSDLMKGEGIILGVNFHVFIPPALPLNASIYFSPETKNNPPRDRLLKAAKIVYKLIITKQLTIDVGNGVTMKVVNPYIVNGEGNVEEVTSGSGTSGGIIALYVILSIILVCLVVYVARKYISQSRWSAYFLTSHPRNTPFRPIVKRNEDTAPFADDEFRDDDELGNMDGMVTDQGGTLQFQA
uniref:VPS10 domain-containing receptor SorCS2-like n=1 Tax=Phallusia mammillata TaxID=59560 RepID=A0A6F9DTL2_9ASCI|nr:VPS10 domain-containing receptor SorCS2-like [Phallusia mammillata]